MVASRRDGGEAVGRAEREAEERQQRKAVVGALGGDASEGAAGDVGIERQQAVEAVRRVGVDRVGAVAQAGLVFGDLALCDVAVAARTALVFEQIAQTAAVEVGVGEIGVKLDGFRVVLDGAFDIPQLGLYARAVVVDEHVFRRVEGHFVVVFQRTVVVADLRADDGAVEVGERIGRVELQHAVEVGERLHRPVGARIDDGAVEVGEQVVRIAADRHVAIGFGLLVALLFHLQLAAAVVAHRILAVGADRRFEIGVGLRRIFEVEVADAAVEIGVRNLVLLPDEFVEVVDRFAELLVQQPRDAPAVIGVGQVGAQLDRFGEVGERVVVVAQPRAGDGAVGEGRGEDRILLDGGGEIGLGSQQVVEVVFGDAAQEIAFVGVVVETQQDVERADRVLEVVVYHERAADVVEIVPVVLRPAAGADRQREGQQYARNSFSHRKSLHCLRNALCRRFIAVIGDRSRTAAIAAGRCASLR